MNDEYALLMVRVDVVSQPSTKSARVCPAPGEGRLPGAYPAPWVVDPNHLPGAKRFPCYGYSSSYLLGLCPEVLPRSDT